MKATGGGEIAKRGMLQGWGEEKRGRREGRKNNKGEGKGGRGNQEGKEDEQENREEGCAVKGDEMKEGEERLGGVGRVKRRKGQSGGEREGGCGGWTKHSDFFLFCFERS